MAAKTEKSGSRVKKTTKNTAAKTKSSGFHIRREIWAALALFMAFLACLSVFKVDGWLIKGYDWLTRTLVGFGANVLPFAFMTAGVILLIKRKGKARLKVASVMSLPVTVGALYQVAAKACGWKGLGKSGRELLSGGLIAGFFGNIFNSALSRIGAIILLSVLIALGLFLTFSELIIKLVKAVKDWRPEPEPVEEEKPQQVTNRTATTTRPSPAVRTRRRVDVYSEDEPAAPQEEPSAKAPVKSETPVQETQVKTPAQVMRSLFEKKEKPAPHDPTLPITPSFETKQVSFEPPVEEEPEFTPVFEEPAKTEPKIVVSASRPRQTAAEKQAASEKAAAEAEEVAAQIETALSGEKEVQYMYPPVSLLNESQGKPKASLESIKNCGERLIDTLQSFGVEAQLVGITAGPTVTRFELQLQRGIKVSRVEGLSTDIALALGASGVRISTIPDKNAIGIEIPNEVPEVVTLRDIVGTQKFRESSSKLSFAVGKDIEGECVIGDISKMPHMLIAGTTGSGKSVCINAMLMSLLYKSTPEEVRLIMVDPKMIELKVYNGIPHLLIPVVTDPRKAAGALNWAVGEMMKRYQLFSEVGTRDLKSYNAEMKKREGGETLPQVVIVIDELSDLMATSKNEVEGAIIRLAQMARAAGMHLIIATQRPSADVITGLMKANIPSRIAFAVSQGMESRIILDQMGAEKLIGRGDMLYSPLGGGKPRRVQGCFVSDQEVERVVEFIKNNSNGAEYSDEIMEHIENHGKEAQAEAQPSGAAPADADDDMFDAAVDVVIESGQASTSMLQRRLKLGYARAARMMDMMEERGIVGGFEGSKPRQILITRDQWAEMKLRKSDDE